MLFFRSRQLKEDYNKKLMVGKMASFDMLPAVLLPKKKVTDKQF